MAKIKDHIMEEKIKDENDTLAYEEYRHYQEIDQKERLEQWHLDQLDRIVGADGTGYDW